MAARNKYYTTKEAQEITGLNAVQLLGAAKQGKITRHVPPENSRVGLYLKVDIDRFAQELRAFYEKEETTDAKKKIA